MWWYYLFIICINLLFSWDCISMSSSLARLYSSSQEPSINIIFKFIFVRLPIGWVFLARINFMVTEGSSWKQVVTIGNILIASPQSVKISGYSWFSSRFKTECVHLCYEMLGCVTSGDEIIGIYIHNKFMKWNEMKWAEVMKDCMLRMLQYG